MSQSFEENQEISRFKSVTVHHLLVKPADRNYFLARHCRIFGFHGEFFWQALQAIEKYLKAAMVLNDIEHDKKSHKICELAACLKKSIPPDLFPSLARPSELPEPYCWRDGPTEVFLRTIEMQGHADSRYGMASTFPTSDDLFKLDKVVFELRRLSIGLDWVIGHAWPCTSIEENYEGQTFRQLLVSEPNVQIRDWTEIPNTHVSIAGNLFSDGLTAWNYLLGRNRDDISGVPPRSVMPSFGPIENSILGWGFPTVRYEGKERETMLAGWRWLRERIVIPKDVRTHFDHVYGVTKAQ